MMKQALKVGQDYEHVASAISLLQDNSNTQPGLDALAAHTGLSPADFQRLLRRWAGVSPQRFLECLAIRQAQRLEHAQDMLDGDLQAGLHARFVSIEALNPRQYKTAGQGLAIAYGFCPSPFGEMLLACIKKSICALSFIEQGKRQEAIAALEKSWPGATLSADQGGAAACGRAIIQAVSGTKKTKRQFKLAVCGTDFQLKVWRALLKIPSARITSYQALARLIGRSDAVRASANAVAANPVALLIPCHRVLRSTGALGGYRWGVQRKRIMLAWELAQGT